MSKKPVTIDKRERSLFVSYARSDRVIAEKLAASLERLGYDSWWDAKLEGGSAFTDTIDDLLQRVDAVLVIWSKRSIASNWVRDEAAVGRDRNRLVPLSIDGAEPPLGFRQLHVIDLRQWRGRASDPEMKAIDRAVTALLSDPDPIEEVDEGQSKESPLVVGTSAGLPFAGSKYTGLTRRVMLGGTVTGVAAVSAALFFGLDPGRSPAPAPSPEIEALMRQGQLALGQSTREGQNQAIALYRQVVTLDAQYADGWGALGVAYGISSHYRANVENRSLGALARAAGQRALGLQDGNALGQAALAMALPALGNWHEIELSLRRSIDDHPRNEALLGALATTLTAVGRNVDALPLYEKIASITQPTPAIYYWQIQALWRAERMEETDALIARASTLYPTHFAIWFSKLYIAMFSGRLDAAIALSRDRSARPTGIPSGQFDDILAVAEALQGGDARAIDAVLEQQRNGARTAAGLAENAIQFAAALGRVDEAFDLLGAYYFAKPFEVPEVRFTIEQGTFTPKADRMTQFIFNPPLKAVRADPRFEALVARLGLRRYWRDANQMPDYLRNDAR